MIQSISVVLAVISPLSFPVLFSLVQGKDLSVLFIFSKNQLLVSLILAVAFLVSISLTSTLIFIISFLSLNSVLFFELLKVKFSSVQFSSLQSLSCVRLFATPWIAARQASLSITNSQSSPRLLSIESVMPSSHLILCRPLLLLPPIPPSIRIFSNESTLRMR